MPKYIEDLYTTRYEGLVHKPPFPQKDLLLKGKSFLFFRGLRQSLLPFCESPYSFIFALRAYSKSDCGRWQ
ncbi:hypothetical protein SAMN05216383_1029 [Prevotella sp. KH2C16]|nr:hypothetical protein SAMN05216383_1029 [Prevotella sp. KH2C16]